MEALVLRADLSGGVLTEGHCVAIHLHLQQTHSLKGGNTCGGGGRPEKTDLRSDGFESVVEDFLQRRGI